LTKTIGLKPLKQFCKYTLYTGYVENSLRPVSGLIIASPERGKTTEATRYEGKGIAIIQDLTSFGIDRYLTELNTEDKDILHHIVIPDLEKIASRNRFVREELLAKMRILMEEGLKEICTGKDRIHFATPIKIAFLMCTTPSDLGDKRSVYRSLSFQSRCIPFTFDVSDHLKDEILRFVQKENHITNNKKIFERRKKCKVSLPEIIAEKLDDPAKKLAREIEKFSKKDYISKKDGNLIGVRIKENFMTLLKAIALYHKCMTVEEKHYQELMEIYRWMNFSFNKIDETE
jgi:hypothetical protein